MKEAVSPHLTVRVKLLGILGQVAQKKTLEFTLPKGCTVAGIIMKLVDEVGNSFRATLLDVHGNLNGGIEVVLNGEHISAYQLEDVKIWKDSELILVPIIAGGTTSEGFLTDQGGHNV